MLWRSSSMSPSPGRKYNSPNRKRNPKLKRCVCRRQMTSYEKRKMESEIEAMALHVGNMGMYDLTEQAKHVEGGNTNVLNERQVGAEVAVITFSNFPQTTCMENEMPYDEMMHTAPSTQKKRPGDYMELCDLPKLKKQNLGDVADESQSFRSQGIDEATGKRKPDDSMFIDEAPQAKMKKLSDDFVDESQTFRPQDIAEATGKRKPYDNMFIDEAPQAKIKRLSDSDDDSDDSFEYDFDIEDEEPIGHTW